MKNRKVYSYPAIGEWLEETLLGLDKSYDYLIEITKMGRGTFFNLLKGGPQI